MFNKENFMLDAADIARRAGELEMSTNTTPLSHLNSHTPNHAPLSALKGGDSYTSLSDISPLGGLSEGQDNTKVSSGINSNGVRNGQQRQYYQPPVPQPTQQPMQQPTQQAQQQYQQPSMFIENTNQGANDYMDSIMPTYDFASMDNFSNMDGLQEATPPKEIAAEDDIDITIEDTPPDDPTEIDPPDDEPVEDVAAEDDVEDPAIPEEGSEEVVDEGPSEEEIAAEEAKVEAEKKNRQKLFKVYTTLLETTTVLHEKIETFKFREELQVKDKYETYTFIRDKVSDMNVMISDLLTKKFTTLDYDQLIYIYGQSKEKVVLLGEMFMTLFVDGKTKKKIKNIE